MKKEEWCEAHFGDELPDCLPLRLHWDKDTSPAALVAEAHELLQESSSFAWTKQGKHGMSWDRKRAEALPLPWPELSRRKNGRALP